MMLFTMFWHDHYHHLICRTSIDEWKTTPWVEIDVENMDMECKKFAKVRTD